MYVLCTYRVSQYVQCLSVRTLSLAVTVHAHAAYGLREHVRVCCRCHISATNSEHMLSYCCTVKSRDGNQKSDRILSSCEHSAHQKHVSIRVNVSFFNCSDVAVQHSDFNLQSSHLVPNNKRDVGYINSSKISFKLDEKYVLRNIR